MLLIPSRMSEWFYWLIYSIFLVCLYKYFVDNSLAIIKCTLFPVVIIATKFVIDLIMFKINANLKDLLLSAYFSQIEAFLFQLLILIILFLVFGRRKYFNISLIFRSPLVVLSCGIVSYIIIAVLFRMQDPIDTTIILANNVSYQLALQMRNINFIFNLMVLPCLWIIIRNLTSKIMK